MMQQSAALAASVAIGGAAAGLGGLSGVSSSDECRLLVGPFSLFAQVVLGVVALCSLVIKWRCEAPPRPVEVWRLDVLKQAAGGFLAHILNVLIAVALASAPEQNARLQNLLVHSECPMYFINFAVDVCFGVPLAALLLFVLERVARAAHWQALQHHGVYGSPPSTRVWVVQFLAWLVILLTTKCALAIPLYRYRARLADLADAVFEPLHAYPKEELVGVMIVAPTLLNIVQYNVIDTLLMDRSRRRICGCCQRSARFQEDGATHASRAEDIVFVDGVGDAALEAQHAAEQTYSVSKGHRASPHLGVRAALLARGSAHDAAGGGGHAGARGGYGAMNG